MKKSILSYLILALTLLSFSSFSQTENQADEESTLLGLPGDNLDLFAVLDLFQKSKTIEEFEKTLNLEETGINNLDLNLDDKADFIKVVTEQDGDDFSFVLQVDVSEKEIQDVAVILVSKDKDGKVTMQMVGDKDLYGENYVIEPAPPAPAVTPNPAYAGKEPVPEAVPASTVVVVESAPIVQYVYSPVYVPYYPPYYYSYYPPYFRAFTVMAVGVYRHNHYYNHHGYHGGYHGNTVVIHNNNNYNNYNNNRNSSNTVNNNKANGNYNNRASASTRPSTGQGSSPSTRPSTGQGSSPSTRPSTGQGSSPSTRPSTGQGASPSTRPSTGQGASPSTRPSTGQGSSPSARPATSPSTRPSASPSSSQSRGSSPSARPSSSASRSMGSSRSAGGASRGGGGRRR